MPSEHIRQSNRPLAQLTFEHECTHSVFSRWICLDFYLNFVSRHARVGSGLPFLFLACSIPS